MPPTVILDVTDASEFIRVEAVTILDLFQGWQVLSIDHVRVNQSRSKILSVPKLVPR
jgi:hypothetical protein